uniref:Ovule protein n=1 Tax=Steinernema glaseri TaxID=37863 RepID=A0A1I7YXJ3_9BILA
MKKNPTLMFVPCLSSSDLIENDEVIDTTFPTVVHNRRKCDNATFGNSDVMQRAKTGFRSLVNTEERVPRKRRRCHVTVGTDHKE